MRSDKGEASSSNPARSSPTESSIDCSSVSSSNDRLELIRVAGTKSVGVMDTEDEVVQLARVGSDHHALVNDWDYKTTSEQEGKVRQYG